MQSEMKQARQQSQELQRTGQYIESLLASDPKKELNKTSSPMTKHSPLKGDIKARFSDPPAPPPSQPLPEKPDAAQPSLRRSETEKPKLPPNFNPGKGDASLQITTLVEALSSAKKEFDVQSLRLKELEDMLAQERLARESAEERAQRLELERQKDMPENSLEPYTNGVSGPPTGEAPVPTNDPVSEETTIMEPPKPAESDVSTALLQQRVESMVAEMDRMRQEMEAYKQRAEKAETESAKDRQTLAEMVESIRKQEVDRAAKVGRGSELGDDQAVESATGVDGAKDLASEDGSANGTRSRPGSGAREKEVQNGQPVQGDQSVLSTDKSSHALATKSPGGEQLAHVGPYASMVGVVVLGLSIMAYINGWQKPLER